MSHRAFLSYASEDLGRARRLRNDLVQHGVDVWFDKQDLKPGKWQPQLKKAIVTSRYFLICLSEAAIRKIGDQPGYQDEELELAFDIAQAQDANSFTIIPVRFEDCGRGDHRVAMFQQFDLFPDWSVTLQRLGRHISGSPGLPHGSPTTTDVDDNALADNLRWKASALYGAGLHSDALAVLDTLIALYGSSTFACHNKSVILSEQRRFSESLAAVERALALSGDYAPARIHMAGILVNLGRHLEGLNLCQAELLKRPRDARLLATASGALIGLGEHDRALLLAEQAIDIEPNLAIAHANKAAALGKLNRIPEALAAALKAVALDARCVPALNSIGTALRRLGRLSESIAAYRTAVSFDPSFWTAQQGLADVLDQAGQLGEAISIYEQLASSPAHGFSYEAVLADLRDRHSRAQHATRAPAPQSDA